MRTKSVLEQGYFLNYSEDNIENNHIFCGQHDIKGAFCPNCNKPFLRFATFDLDNPKLDISLNNIKRLHFLYCWTCNIAQDHFFYKIISDQEIKIIEYKKGGMQSDFPYKDYPLFFPQAHLKLEEVSKEVQDIISQFNSGELSDYPDGSGREQYSWPKHQIGGEPYYVFHPIIEKNCPECGIKMPFLLSIAPDCLDKRGFVDYNFVQVIFSICINCQIIGVHNASD